MPAGVVILLVVAILVYFGLLHRVLDRMRLDDRTALLVLFLMTVGSFFNLTVFRRPVLIVNVGGAIIPLGVAVYLVATCDTRVEKLRGAAAAIVAGAAIYLASKVLNPEEQTMIIDPTYFFGVIAGVVGYLAGRSRRAAFVGGTVGVILADIAHYVDVALRGIRGRAWIGGAGVFDAVVIAGLLAVLLAEVVGETRELMTRGPLPVKRRGANRGGGVDPGGGSGDRSAHDGGGGFVAAFGLAGGSGRGTRTRDSHRAGGRSRRASGRTRGSGGGAKTKVTTTEGEGRRSPVLSGPSGSDRAGETRSTRGRAGRDGESRA